MSDFLGNFHLISDFFLALERIEVAATIKSLDSPFGTINTCFLTFVLSLALLESSGKLGLKYSYISLNLLFVRFFLNIYFFESSFYRI